MNCYLAQVFTANNQNLFLTYPQKKVCQKLMLNVNVVHLMRPYYCRIPHVKRGVFSKFRFQCQSGTIRATTKLPQVTFLSLIPLKTFSLFSSESPFTLAGMEEPLCFGFFRAEVPSLKQFSSINILDFLHKTNYSKMQKNAH